MNERQCQSCGLIYDTHDDAKVFICPQCQDNLKFNARPKPKGHDKRMKVLEKNRDRI